MRSFIKVIAYLALAVLAILISWGVCVGSAFFLGDSIAYSEQSSIISVIIGRVFAFGGLISIFVSPVLLYKWMFRDSGRGQQDT